MHRKPFKRCQVDTFKFKIPPSYDAKHKIPKNNNRHLWCTPDTLFILCELKLRNYLAPMNYNYFWPKVMLLLHKTTDKINLSQYLLLNNKKNNYQSHWDKLTDELKHLQIKNVKMFCTKKQLKLKDSLRGTTRRTTTVPLKTTTNYLTWDKSVQQCEIQINDQFFDLNEHN